MNFLDPNHNDIEALPPALRAMLDAELAAGNAIAEVSHGFPAPPCGACIKMVRALSTQPGEGLQARSWPNWNRSGGFGDEKGHFFLLSPPEPEPEQPTMDEIRARMNPPADPVAEREATVLHPAEVRPAASKKNARAATSRPSSTTPLGRFEASMIMDYEKWREGIGYDLDALHAASPAERQRIESLLIAQDPVGWREVEALAALDTPRARRALVKAMKEGNAEVRMAVTRHAPQLVPDDTRLDSLLKALRTAEFYGGLSQALDEVEENHPPEVMDELLRGLLEREGGVAVHFAAMLFYLHGKATEPFDWAHRPFFLRFHTDDPGERLAVYQELCLILGIDPERNRHQPSSVSNSPIPTHEQATD
jgi:hypothetical protein